MAVIKLFGFILVFFIITSLCQVKDPPPSIFPPLPEPPPNHCNCSVGTSCCGNTCCPQGSQCCDQGINSEGNESCCPIFTNCCGKNSDGSPRCCGGNTPKCCVPAGPFKNCDDIFDISGGPVCNPW